MQFIALLISLMLMQYWGSVSFLQKDQWFYSLAKLSRHYFPSNSLLADVLPIVVGGLVFLIIYEIVGDWFWGLFDLIISIAILLYSFGRGEFNQVFERYSEAWRLGNLDQLQNIIGEVDSDYTYVDSDKLNQIHVNARESLLYVGFQRLFVVLFWFAFLGPVAPLVYRLLSITNDMGDNVALKEVQRIIEWPAARLLALSFVVVGNFNAGLSACASSLFHPNMTNKQVVSVSGLASSGMDMQWLSLKFYEAHDNKSLAIKASDEVKLIKQLLTRSLVMVVVGFALLQLF